MWFPEDLEDSPFNSYPGVPTSVGGTGSVTTSEPPQVAITPPKVVVVTTPSGTVLRPNTSTSTTTAPTTALFEDKPIMTPTLGNLLMFFFFNWS